jgi:hypothetical protein
MVLVRCWKVECLRSRSSRRSMRNGRSRRQRSCIMMCVVVRLFCCFFQLSGVQRGFRSIQRARLSRFLRSYGGFSGARDGHCRFYGLIWRPKVLYLRVSLLARDLTPCLMALHRIAHGFNAILGISALNLVKGLLVVEVTRSFVPVEADDSPNASPKRTKCRLPSPQNYLYIVSEHRTHIFSKTYAVSKVSSIQPLASRIFGWSL